MDVLEAVGELERYRQKLSNDAKDLQHDIQVLKGIGNRHETTTVEGAVRGLRQKQIQTEKSLSEINSQLDLFRLHVPKAQSICRKLSGRPSTASTVGGGGLKSNIKKQSLK
eukprot:PhF_6_TR3215/c0_g1_i1/m.4595